jgi:hypothetical protein
MSKIMEADLKEVFFCFINLWLNVNRICKIKLRNY